MSFPRQQIPDPFHGLLRCPQVAVSGFNDLHSFCIVFFCHGSDSAASCTPEARRRNTVWLDTAAGEWCLTRTGRSWCSSPDSRRARRVCRHTRIHLTEQISRRGIVRKFSGHCTQARYGLSKFYLPLAYSSVLTNRLTYPILSPQSSNYPHYLVVHVEQSLQCVFGQ